MKLLVIGSGRVGAMVVNSLSFEDVEIDVIDKSTKALSQLKSKNVKKINQNVLEGDFLSTLDFSKYDYVLSLTDQDKTNILISTMAAKGDNKTLVRFNKIDSVAEMNYLQKTLGIDYCINPQYEVSKAICQIIGHDNYYAADYFGRGKIEVAGHSVDLDPEFENVALKDIGSLATILVVAIARGSQFFIPHGETILQRGDYLYLMGLSQDIRTFKHNHFIIEKKERNKNITMIGGNMIINQRIASMGNVNLTIIEEDEQKAKEYRQRLSDAYVIHRDLQKENIFEEEELYGEDLVIAMTEADETNIVLGLMAKNHDIPTTIIQVKSPAYSPILDPLGLSSVLNPENICANEILKGIRSGEGVSINLMFGGRAQVLEIRISKDFPHIGKTLSEIKVEEGIIIGGIVRENGVAVIPRGATIIEKGDRLVVFCTNESRNHVAKLLNPSLNRGFFDFLG